VKRWVAVFLGLLAFVLTMSPATDAASQPMIGLRGAHMMPIRRPKAVWSKRLLGVREKIVYEHIDHQDLTFYIFRPRIPDSRPRAVVIYIHGGALRYGTAMITDRNTPHNRLMVSVERSLIKRGIDFVSVNYRLAPLYPWPDPLHDVKHAVNYLIGHSRRLGIDPTQMAVMGDSAGGELSSFVGLTLRKGADGTPVMRAVVDLFGPTNRRTFAIKWRRRHGLQPNPVYGVYTWTRVKRESAISYVHRDAPPFLIIQGTRDRIVPPNQSKLLKKKLWEAEVPVKEILVHHAGHELVAVHGRIRPGIPVIARHIVRFLTTELHEAPQVASPPGKLGA